VRLADECSEMRTFSSSQHLAHSATAPEDGAVVEVVSPTRDDYRDSGTPAPRARRPAGARPHRPTTAPVFGPAQPTSWRSGASSGAA
jgi:hypothetical protein